MISYYCDDSRHLVCAPYSVENLHIMAADLNIKRCWFHGKKDKAHYDIPKRRTDEIRARCKVVSSKEIVNIIKFSHLTCGNCGAYRVKLYRPYGSFYRPDDNRCNYCVRDEERSYYVPCIPTSDGYIRGFCSSNNSNVEEFVSMQEQNIAKPYWDCDRNCWSNYKHRR